jgi:ubiquinone/menaquinone biosynthesis C-methylase UbiE
MQKNNHIPKTIEEQADLYISEFFEGSSEWEKQKAKEDWLNKERAAHGLVVDVKKRAGQIDGKHVLEIGFGCGLQVAVFSEEGARMSGLEVTKRLKEFADVNLKQRNISADVRLYDGEHFPFEDNSFDIVYATSVLEHVDSLSAVIGEAYRVLRPGGLFYVSFPNRLWPKETHTGVWFLNYMSRPIAKFILEKVLKRKSFTNWNLHFLSYWKIKRVLKKYHINFAVKMETENASFFKKAFKRTLSRLGIHHSAILRTVMIILEKKV